MTITREQFREGYRTARGALCGHKFLGVQIVKRSTASAAAFEAGLRCRCDRALAIFNVVVAVRTTAATGRSATKCKALLRQQFAYRARTKYFRKIADKLPA